jgi:acyl-CoA dehydrogenase
VDVGYTAEQESLRTSVRGVLSDHAPLTALRARYGSAPTALDDAWWKLEDLGVSEILTPADRGGLGLGMVDLGVVLEECGRALYDGPVVAAAVSAAYLVSALGDDSAAGRSAAALGVVALHEHGRRFDWRTPAVTVTDSRLSGAKVHVPHATLADVFLVVATNGDGLGVWRVPAGDDRVVVTPEDVMDGSSPTATVTFDDLPAERVGTGDATDAVAAMVDRTVLAHVVEGVGTAQRAFEMTLAYAREREQFGRPIGSFQAVQGLCVEMLQTLELGRAAAHYALWALDHADAAESHRAVTMAKAWAGDGFYRLGATAIQVFGGIGFTWEHDIGLYYKRLLTLQHSWGTTSDHLESLATQIL